MEEDVPISGAEQLDSTHGKGFGWKGQGILRHITKGQNQPFIIEYLEGAARSPFNCQKLLAEPHRFSPIMTRSRA
jgi:hypothetical protein